MKYPQISIVVPIYNVEQYLERCMQSLVNQTYRNVEIILVNDGSTDGSSSICDKYENMDQRIQVIHKLNGGLSDARNFGLKVSRGEYVLFVDSDDYIELDACEKLYNVIKQFSSDAPDLIIGNARKIHNDTTTYLMHKGTENYALLSGPNYMLKELKTESLHMAVWLNLYRNEFLKKNNLEFKVGLLHEDEQFTPRVLLKANNVICTDIIFYNYIIRSSSITMSKDLSVNGLHIIETCNELSSLYEQVGNVELKKMLMNNLVTKYLSAIKTGKLHRKEYKDSIDLRFMYSRVYSRKNLIQLLMLSCSSKLYAFVYRMISK
ncbi:glycosyltransferase [Paenibacillus typhae]|uniref:Glycosyl transferase family 2 n=1 Tax=Paenibacillus typhae TaxID=1174501 RepID=A0A1G8RQS3_9BACL|nr:glycosyltransferase [Paenibacillus typhae]SDJ18855.1 Glycosyl transferase family 2 [Paenibacillus typhae]